MQIGKQQPIALCMIRRLLVRHQLLTAGLLCNFRARAFVECKVTRELLTPMIMLLLHCYLGSRVQRSNNISYNIACSLQASYIQRVISDSTRYFCDIKVISASYLSVELCSLLPLRGVNHIIPIALKNIRRALSVEVQA